MRRRKTSGRQAKERARSLPSNEKCIDDCANTERLLRVVAERDYAKGICAYENDTLCGYILSGISTTDIGERSAFVGYGGMAIRDGESPELYRRMYAEIAKVWIAHGALYHNVMVPAGYSDVVNSWLELSFAYGQVYGITALSKADTRNPAGVTVRQAQKADADSLRALSNIICSCQAAPPTFASTRPERVKEIQDAYGELPEDDECLTFIAYKADKPVGFISADFESDELDYMRPQKAFEISICGTAAECRNEGVATLLTQTAINRCIELGYENAIVDWRIANLYSSGFWRKRGFIPVAYRMYRKIESSVYWADGLMQPND